MLYQHAFVAKVAQGIFFFLKLDDLIHDGWLPNVTPGAPFTNMD